MSAAAGLYRSRFGFHRLISFYLFVLSDEAWMLRRRLDNLFEHGQRDLLKFFEPDAAFADTDLSQFFFIFFGDVGAVLHRAHVHADVIFLVRESDDGPAYQFFLIVPVGE